MPWEVGAQQVLLTAASLIIVVLIAAAWLITSRRRRGLRIRHGAHEPAAIGADSLDRPWVAVVANPTKVDDADERARWIDNASTTLGLAPSMWLETTPEDPGGGSAKTALQAGAQAVLAYGGDGTVRAVAAELAGTGVPLGLVPAGTGNLLARNLGVPTTDLDAALAVALAGTDRKVDVGAVEVDVSGEDHRPRQDVFCVMAGLGFDAEVMAAVEPKLKERVGWWAYVVVGTRNLRGARTKVSIRLDDAPPVHRHVRSVIVGNCGELTGGVRLLPAAELDDGWLDVVVLTPRGVAGWAAVTATVLTRVRRGHPIVHHFRCRQIEVRAERPMAVQLDGDPAGEARVLRAAVDPLALVVRVPPLAL